MANKITEFFSEYSVKDNATATIKSIRKENAELKKSIKQGKKELKDATKSNRTARKKDLAEQKKDFQKSQKFRDTGIGRVGERVSGIGERLAGGNVFGAIGSTLPVVGGLIVAAAASIEKAAAAFDTAAKATTERARFKRAVVASPEVAAIADQLQKQGFAREDIESSISQLSEKGIKLDANQIKVFAKQADRFGSLSETFARLLSGEGLADLGPQGKVVEAIAKNLNFGDSLAAQTSFDVLVNQIDNLNRTEQKLIDSQSKATVDAKAFTRLSKDLQSARDTRAIDLAGTEGIFKAVNVGENIANEFIKVTAKESAKVLGGVGDFISNPSGFVDSLFESPVEAIKKSQKRAGGGNVNAGQSYLVGEQGQELFTPKTSGTITPNNKLGKSTTINFGGINITVNSQASTTQGLIEALKQQIPSILNSYANTILSRELGLSEGLA